MISLNLKNKVQLLKRKNDIISYKADIKLAKKNINWMPKVNFKQIVKKMLNNELF